MAQQSSQGMSAREGTHSDQPESGAHVQLRRRVRVDGDAAARALGQALAARIDGEVRFGDADRALYATDAGNYRHVPVGVVIPRTVDDVERTVALCRASRVPVLARGGGTGLGGQSCNVAVVMDFSKYLNAVVELDAPNRRARVQPGTVLDDLRSAAEEHGLTFGPDPATHRWCTLGGMIGNDACGVHSVLSEFHGPGPRTEDHVLELEVLTYDGLRMRVGRTSDAELARITSEGGRRAEIYTRLRQLRDRHADLIRQRFPDIPRRVSGFNLPALLPENGFDVGRALVGSESTCVTVLEATVALSPSFPKRALVMLGYPSVYDAGDHVALIRKHRPVGLEGMDDRLVRFMNKKGLRTENLRHLPEGGGWLLVEFGGADQEEADALATDMMDALRREGDAPAMALYSDADEQAAIWEVRESGLGATAFVPGEPDAWPGWEDSAVAPEHIGDYLRDLRSLFEKYDYTPSLYGHFGQGCVHTRVDFDFHSAGGRERYRAFTLEAAELVAGRYQGSLSGEHGDGQARGELLPIMYGDELMEVFREFKSIWDPDGGMNPGKVVDARPRDQDLRVGPAFAPAPVTTRFHYPEDGGSFARATMRCVGVGKCRRTDAGTMCPSFQVLREEEHTTRGRAHLLFEMLQGETITDGWRSEAVKESLDLCLSCKGCKGECPVNVDIATYKAEFLSHYYERRLRPRAAYAFGLIEWLSRAASVAPGVANFATQTPGLDRIAKWAAGIDQRRRVPAFASRTFRQWWRGRERRGGGATRVILWPDSFNNHFHPGVLQAAVEVLEHAGCEVTVPSRWFAAGRPLYEYGMVDLARWQLRQILEGLEDEIASGTPVVVLEPSEASVFRDELGNLFPDDDRAKRLAARTFTLGEFLLHGLEDYEPPTLGGTVMLHGHCHQKAVLKADADVALLEHMGLRVEAPDTGCCGMAGAFGFEKGAKYDISVARGEQALLPAVRSAGNATLIVTDGFSCREQIEQSTDRRPLHTAEVLQLALARGGAPRSASRPEVELATLRAPSGGRTRRSLGLTLMAGSAVLAAGAAIRRRRRVPAGHSGAAEEVPPASIPPDREAR